MKQAFLAVTAVGLALLVTAAGMRARAWTSRLAGSWTSRRAGDTSVFRKMERDSLRGARIMILTGVPLAALGLAGWLLTR